MPWRTQASPFIELPVDDINSQGFNVLLSVRHFERILLGQKY
jgi:hypothetical protein